MEIALDVLEHCRVGVFEKGGEIEPTDDGRPELGELPGFLDERHAGDQVRASEASTSTCLPPGLWAGI